MLRAIDIAHPWQDGIDPANVDCDIVIVKVSGGTCYTNPKYREWADAALASGKLLGFYHYACERDTEPGGKAEADYFWERVKDYKGKAVLILDWENHAHQMPVSYAKAFLDRIAELSGSTPFFYDYAGHLNATDYSAIAKYPLWMASYLSRYNDAGWVDSPSNIWSTGNWNNMKMYQYTSTGRISGYSGNLDLSVFYGNANDWNDLKGGCMSSIEKMVQHAVSIANNDYYGYSWADRWDHDRDCSSLMYDSANAAGYPVGRGPDKTRYTGTMIDDFTAAGFTKYNFGSVVLKRGDILLRDPWGSGGHTEMYLGNNQCVGAHSAENGGVYGQPGDQTGNEISITTMWGNWDYVLRPQERSESMGKWIEKDGKWWYKHSNGSYTVNDWEYIGNHWYWFDQEGWMKTGWIKWKDHWFYCDPEDGHMVTGWKKIKWNGKDSWFYFMGDGTMVDTCFLYIGNGWYAFDKNGCMIEDLATVSIDKNGTISFK